MKRLVTAAFAASAALFAAAAFAQATDGEVVKVDKPAARITVKHDGIKQFDMPPMALAFRVADPKMLDGVAVGDKVRFVADKVNGTYTITSLSKAR
jgi:Cu(I)/Ag(I) efflux system protein CusF